MTGEETVVTATATATTTDGTLTRPRSNRPARRGPRRFCVPHIDDAARRTAAYSRPAQEHHDERAQPPPDPPNPFRLGPLRRRGLPDAPTLVAHRHRSLLAARRGASWLSWPAWREIVNELLKRLALFLVGMIAAAWLGSIDWAPTARPLSTRLAMAPVAPLCLSADAVGARRARHCGRSATCRGVQPCVKARESAARRAGSPSAARAGRAGSA